MNEDTIKAIEEQLRLRNERLALREKEFGLSAKKWRVRGTAFAIVVLLGICGMAVFFGGTGLGNLSGEINKPQSSASPGENPDTVDKQSPVKTSITPPANSLTVVSPEKGKNVVVKAESNTISDKWPLMVAIIVNGVLVIVGLGVAALTVKNIANYNNELE